MNWKLWIASLVGITLAGVAGFYSVFGISKLFIGAGLAIIIMAGTLEIAKIVATLLIHKYWDVLNIAYRAYYTTAIIVLMTITSMGIYGFLASAYQETSNQYSMNITEIELLETKKEQFSNQILVLGEQTDLKYDRIGKLNDIRTAQENRLDTLYNRRWVNSARRTEATIKKANDDISQANLDIDNMNAQVLSLQDSIYSVEREMMSVKTKGAAQELGPLIYISDITGYPMDKVVNILILLFIFVFDPMALILLITVQKLTMKGPNTNDDREPQETRSPIVPGPDPVSVIIPPNDTNHDHTDYDDIDPSEAFFAGVPPENPNTNDAPPIEDEVVVEKSSPDGPNPVPVNWVAPTHNYHSESSK